MAVELWDAYDINRKPLGYTLIRGSQKPKFSDGEYHIVVNIFIVNTNGEILLTQRHPDKHFPLLWECTGGSVTTGEDSLTGAMREVEEEIGLTLPPEKFKLVESVRRESDFLDTYLVITDVDIVSLTYQPEEVIGGKIVTFDEYKSMWEQALIVPSLSYFFEIYTNNIIKGREET